MIDSLHQAAADEAAGQDGISERIRRLLTEGADPHALDAEGESAFNIAAPASPVAGQLMTRHWFDLAINGQGSKGLNDPSGSHGSTLAQYIAKWALDSEIDNMIARGVAAGMVIDRANKSGWTPLMAASAMGRVVAVKAFGNRYSAAALSHKTTEEYRAVYNGVPVVYAAGLDAAGVAATRLAQDGGSDTELKQQLKACIAYLLNITDQVSEGVRLS